MCWSRDGQLTGHRVWRQVVSVAHTQGQSWVKQHIRDTWWEGEMTRQSQQWLEVGVKSA